MNINAQSNMAAITLPVVREYEVGGVKFIVSATVKEGAKETAKSKVRRLIRNEVSKIIL
jgi:hypothetical protein